MGRNRNKNKRRNRERLQLLDSLPSRDPKVLPLRGDVLQSNQEIRRVLKVKAKNNPIFSIVMFKSEDIGVSSDKIGFTLVKKSTLTVLTQTQKVSLSDWQTWCQQAKILHKKN